MKVYLLADEGRDTLIEAIIHHPDPEKVYVLWQVDLHAEGVCYLYVEKDGVLHSVRAGCLHQKTFEDFILERYSIPETQPKGAG